jgi:hypothetical protein
MMSGHSWRDLHRAKWKRGETLTADCLNHHRVERGEAIDGGLDFSPEQVPCGELDEHFVKRPFAEAMQPIHGMPEADIVEVDVLGLRFDSRNLN